MLVWTYQMSGVCLSLKIEGLPSLYQTCGLFNFIYLFIFQIELKLKVVALDLV